jgi:hypothetical protein
MFRAVRIAILLFILFFVSVNAYLTQARSTDWNSSLWVKVYPINADGSQLVATYIDDLELRDFGGIESFLQRETERYRPGLDRPVRMELGNPVREQPPAFPDSPHMFSIMLWSLRMRWWSSTVTGDHDEIEPDVRIFVRYHTPDSFIRLENSVGLQKGMVGIVNGYASRRHRGANNVIIAHEFLHTLGATDKYSPETGHPIGPDGIAEPDRKPLYPQRYAEIMGGRIALAADDSEMPASLGKAVIGRLTASEINLID